MDIAEMDTDKYTSIDTEVSTKMERDALFFANYRREHGIVLPEEVEEAQPIKFANMRGWDSEPPPQRQWAVPDHIPRGQVTLFSGDGAIGKSTVKLQLCAATVLARDWIGLQPEPGPAIYLGAEDEEDELQRRLCAIAQYYERSFEEMSNNGLYVTSYAGEDMTLARFDGDSNIEPTPLYNRLWEQACDIRPVIIGLDTLSDIFPGNENDRVQVSLFVGLLRKLAMASSSAVIVNAHPSQAGTNSGTGLSGSTGWHGKVRGRMYMRGADDKNDPDLRVLEFKKNNYGPLGEPILLRYQNGIYVPEPRAGSLDARIIEQRAEQVFLTLLDRFTREGRNVTDKKGTTYAPACFAKEQEARSQKLNKGVLADAMLRLFAAKKIRVVTEGPTSRLRSRIVMA